MRVVKEEEESGVIQELTKKVGELSSNMERMRLAEYIQMLENPRRLLYVNFLQGVARGFGTAIGFTLLTALFLYILQKIVILKLPIIGTFIAQLVAIVQSELNI
jgi:hypothetical protein